MFRMRLAMYYDRNFKTKYVTASESVNAMRRVVAQAQNIYYWPSLTVRIRLNVVKEQEIAEFRRRITTLEYRSYLEQL